MIAARSNRTLIVILAVVVVVLIAGGVYATRNAFGPVEARTNPTAQIAVMPPSDGRAPSVEIQFDQRMDRASVERAIQVSPTFEYRIVWDDAITADRVVITPATSLVWNEEFTVSLGIGATNNRGLSLTEAVNVAFTTPRAVKIVNVYPAADAEDVAPTEAITVQFDQAVMDTVTLNKDASAPQPIQIEPVVQGTGQWIAPDTYSFYPTSGLTSGTDYKVRVNGQVAPELALTEPYVWAFTTSGPRLTASYPFDGATDVERATAITLLFTQPMDRESVEQNFLLSTNGEEVPVAGEFVWDDDRHLIFRPADALEVNTEYAVAVERGAKPQGGTNGLQSPYRATFTTVDFLAVESVQPAPGSTEVTIAPTDTVISVQFNHPVVPVVGLTDKDDLPSPIVIAPRLEGEGEWITTSLFVFRPTEPLLPSTEYVVTIPQGTEDALGAYLQEEYAWSFTSEYPRVLRLEPTNENNFINPIGPIGVRFNQPMDPASTEAAFTLRSEAGDAVAGAFAWRDDNALLQFTPATPLDRDASYTIEVAEGAKGELGGATFEPFAVEVATPPQAAVGSTEPKNGDDEAVRYGGIRLTFTSPMDPDLIEEFVTIVPTATAYYTYYDPTSFSFSFFPANLAFLPAETAYTVTVDSDLTDEIGQPLGEDYTFAFTTQVAPPILELAGDFSRVGTYNPYTDTVQIVRHRNLERIDFTLYSLTKQELINAMYYDGYSYISRFEGTTDTIAAQWTQTVTQASNITPLRLTVPPEGEIEPSGAYFLRATTPTVFTYGPDQPPTSPVSNLVFTYTPINLTLKRGPNEILVWATDIRTGQPVADVNLEIYRTADTPLDTGSTDSDGLYRYSFDDITLVGSPYEGVVVLAMDGDTIVGASSTQQNRDISSGQSNIDSNYVPLDVYGTVYTERPIYRPGQTVYFRGVVRSLEGMGLEIPDLTQPITMVISANGQNAITQVVTLSEYGTFSGEFTLDEEAPTGYYSIYAELRELRLCYSADEFNCIVPSISGAFQVAEYVRPEYEVAVSVEDQTFIRGDSLTASIAADFYSGGPVADAPYQYRVAARPYYFTSERFSGYWSWGDYDSYFYRAYNYTNAYEGLDLLTSGEGVLDANGDDVLSIPASDIAPEAREDAFSQEFNIEADVQDVNAKNVTGRTRVVVHAGALYIGLKSDEYIGQIGRPFPLQVVTVDPLDAIVANQEITLDLYQRVYVTTRELQSDGSTVYTATYTDTLESSQKVTTDQEGRVTATLTPEQGGTYTVLATATDANGNEIRSRYYLWVLDSEEGFFWGDSVDSGMELRTNQVSYQVGDVAQILVPTPLENMTALITREQNGIITTEVRQLPTTSELIEVTITEDMIPKAYISVVAVSGADAGNGVPEFRYGIVGLDVQPTEKLLTMTLIRRTDDPNTPMQPGEEVTYDIKVTDADGNPVTTELSLAVVDKATLAVGGDGSTPPSLVDVFYGLRPSRVSVASDLTVNLNRLLRALSPIFEGGAAGAAGVAVSLPMRQHAKNCQTPRSGGPPLPPMRTGKQV